MTGRSASRIQASLQTRHFCRGSVPAPVGAMGGGAPRGCRSWPHRLRDASGALLDGTLPPNDALDRGNREEGRVHCPPRRASDYKAPELPLWPTPSTFSRRQVGHRQPRRGRIPIGGCEDSGSRWRRQRRGCSNLAPNYNSGRRVAARETAGRGGALGKRVFLQQVSPADATLRLGPAPLAMRNDVHCRLFSFDRRRRRQRSPEPPPGAPNWPRISRPIPRFEQK